MTIQPMPAPPPRGPRGRRRALGALGLLACGLVATPLVVPIVAAWRLLVRALLLPPARAGSRTE